MDSYNPVFHPVFFVPHMMFDHYHLRPQTPPHEDIKRDFTPMTTSQGQSAETSPAISSSTLDTLELLLSIPDVLSTLQLDSDREVIGDKGMVVDFEIKKMATEDKLH